MNERGKKKKKQQPLQCEFENIDLRDKMAAISNLIK